MKRLWTALKHISKDLSEQNISAYSASTAFFFFLSLVPMTIILFQILPYTTLTRMDLMAIISTIMPDKLHDFVEYFLDAMYEQALGTLPLAVLVTIWSAGTGTMALKRGLNVVYKVQEKHNYVLLRIWASINTILMLLIVLFIMIVFVFEKQLLALLLGAFPGMQYVIYGLLPFRFVMLWVVLLLALCMVYTFLPTKHQKFKEQLPGAAFVALAWSVFSFGFSVYLSFADYSVYGNLAVIIILLLWFYICMYLLFLGAYINNRIVKNKDSIRELGREIRNELKKNS